MNEEAGLKNSTVALMIVVAFLFDGIQVGVQLAPIVGQIFSEIINVVALLVFFLWFIIHRIKLLTPKRLLTIGGGFLLEVGTIGIVPAWTISVAITALGARVGKIAPVLDIISKK